MTKNKTCEIDEIGIDIACLRRAEHSLKIMSTKLGVKSKVKFRLCDYHYVKLLEKEKLTDLLDENTTPMTSEKYHATLVKDKT